MSMWRRPLVAVRAAQRVLPNSREQRAAQRVLHTSSQLRHNPWAVLGVRRGESLDECKAAFRRLALALHPDISTNEGDAERFAAVVQAYEDIRDGVVGRQRRPRSLRGVRSVDGVLKVSIDELKQDPTCEVFPLVLALDGQPNSNPTREGMSDRSTAQYELNDLSRTSALGTETLHLLHACSDHSISDLHGLAENLLSIEVETVAGRRVSGNELVWHGQLLAEHLFVHDYEISGGDLIHYVVQKGCGK